ncbi:SMI1/KNR4 family protein [Sedimenticola sp.]|uniref:SMI1/KNR4 family protein n=1 Tax=Sedimenticola sp. TaxID=1940285 RepID=UPI003D127530
MQTSFTPYSNDMLPQGFKYPEQYIQFSKGISFPMGLVWWFEDANTDAGKLGWQLRPNYRNWRNMADHNLIPFAQMNDAAAFFDGDNTNGDPKVIVLDLGNKNRSYELPNFDAWLKDALEDSGLSPER